SPARRSRPKGAGAWSRGCGGSSRLQRGARRTVGSEPHAHAGWIPALLRSLAPVADRQGAVLLPAPAGHIQATVAVPRDALLLEGERPRLPNAPQLEGTGEMRVETTDRAAGYWTTRADRGPGLNARTSGVYLRAD